MEKTMTIQEFYEAINSNYDEVFTRLRSESLIQKFVLKFKEDQSYPSLLSAMANEEGKEAFLSRWRFITTASIPITALTSAERQSTRLI